MRKPSSCSDTTTGVRRAPRRRANATREAARTLTAGLVLPALMLLVTGVAAQAAGLSQSEETRLSVEYEGERHFLIRKLSGAEIRELVSDNTLIYKPGRGGDELRLYSSLRQCRGP